MYQHELSILCKFYSSYFRVSDGVQNNCLKNINIYEDTSEDSDHILSRADAIFTSDLNEKIKFN